MYYDIDEGYKKKYRSCSKHLRRLIGIRIDIGHGLFFFSMVHDLYVILHSI